MKHLFLLFISYIGISNCDAQVMFNKMVGDSARHCYTRKVLSTSDGGFLLAIPVSSSGSMFVKLDLNGDTTWTSILADSIYATINSLLELPGNNGYIACGYSNLFLPNHNDVGILCKIDSIGNLVWLKAYSEDTSQHYYFSDLIRMPDDSLLIVGNILMKTDSSGNPSLVCNNIGSDKLLQLTNNEIIILDGNQLVKLSSTGNIIWSYSYGYMNNDIFRRFDSIDTTSDNKYLLTSTIGDQHWYSWAYQYYMKIDTAGNIIWQRTFQNDFISAIQTSHAFSLSENKYGVISGNGQEFSGKLFLMITDSLGIPISTRVDTTFRASYSSNIAVAKTLNNQLFFSWDSYNPTVSKYRSRIFLADSIGNTFCNQVDSTVIIVDTIADISPSVINLIPDTTNIQVFIPSVQIRKGVSIFETDCSTVLNVSENIFSTELILYPNPTSNTVTIKNILSNEITQLQIINTFGEIIYSEKSFGKNECTLHINFATGIYLVQIRNDKSTSVQKLLVE